jgi:mono/diheme cytochrome c family protein
MRSEFWERSRETKCDILRHLTEEEQMNLPDLRILRSLLALLAVAFLFAAPLRADGDGASLFKTKCAMCHGPDGKGEVPMGKKLGARDLTSAEVQKQSDAELTEVVTKGKNKNKMPPYEGKLSKEQIAQLVAYIREIAKKH